MNHQNTCFILTNIYRILCLIGLVVHVWTIGSEYFKYRTNISTYVAFPFEFDSYALSVCFKYADIFDPSFGSKKYGVNFESLDRFEKVSLLERNITLDEIFKHTPSSRSIFVGADVRRSKTYDVDKLDQLAAFDEFEISRYQMLYWICYRFQQKIKLTFNYRDMASAQSFVGMLYKLVIKLDQSQLNSTILMMPIIHGHNDYPTSSYMYAPIDGVNKVRQTNLYRLTSQNVRTSLLEYPHKTNCRNYGKIPRSRRISDCVLKSTIDNLHKLSYTSLKIESELGSRSKLTIIDPQIAKHSENYQKIVRDCERLYRKIGCNQNIYLTQLQSRDKWNIDNLEFRVGHPMNPTIQIIHKPMHSFYTFAVLVLSCFGVWLGWSLMDMNPIYLFEFIQSRNRNEISNRSVRTPFAQHGDYLLSKQEMARKIIQIERLLNNLITTTTNDRKILNTIKYK